MCTAYEQQSSPKRYADRCYQSLCAFVNHNDTKTAIQDYFSSILICVALGTKPSICCSLVVWLKFIIIFILIILRSIHSQMTILGADGVYTGCLSTTP